MSDSLDIFENDNNPLDSIEDVLHDQDWVFSRPNADELTVTVTGKQSSYNMTFIWQEEYNAMQFFCSYDLSLPKNRMDMAATTLKMINEDIWMGHFDIPDDTRVPCFRHTSLFRGWQHSAGAEQTGDLVEIALIECERFYNIFAMLASSVYLTPDLISFALRDNAGRA